MDIAWKAAGACRLLEPELFYPVSDQDAGDAKAVCAACDVRARCLDYAMASREWEGVWGGLTGSERRSLHRKRRVSAAGATA